MFSFINAQEIKISKGDKIENIATTESVMDMEMMEQAMSVNTKVNTCKKI